MNRRSLAWTLAGLAIIGCADRSPPPPRVSVPMDASEGPVYRADPVKPMPAPPAERQLASPPFDDPALVDQELPEQRAFVSAYNAVGRPMLRVALADPQGNADNQAVMLQFADWLRSDGQVAILDPLSAKSEPADVVIHFAVSSATGEQASAVRISARAVNEQEQLFLAQGTVDMPTPADRQAVNRYTRFLARKLMAGMTQTWLAPRPAPRESRGDDRSAAPLEVPSATVPPEPAVPPAAPPTNPG